jgi:phosphoenolpyruvate-protein kinase (PTS system EI component)
MVTSVEEILEARSIIDGIAEEVRQEAGPVDPTVGVGIMIEVPAAVLTVETLACHADFLCVGTNDLIQYTLAVDRGDARVAHLFQPLHPSILHSLARIAEAGRRSGKPVRICGEISSNPLFAVLLLGMGFTQLSMNAHAIPTIRRVVTEVNVGDARRLVSEALQLTTARAIVDNMLEKVAGLFRMDLGPLLQELVGPNGRAARVHDA